jgi:hypothetical protein
MCCWIIFLKAEFCGSSMGEKVSELEKGVLACLYEWMHIFMMGQRYRVLKAGRYFFKISGISIEPFIL